MSLPHHAPRHVSRRALVLLGVLAVLLAGCVGPTPTTARYREHAAGAITQAGEVAAALELVAQDAAADDLVHHYATTLVREQEERAVYAQSAFSGRQPPDDADELRSRVTALLDEAVSLAEEGRILADRGDLAELGALAPRYGDLRDRLEVAERNLRRPEPTGADA